MYFINLEATVSVLLTNDVNGNRKSRHVLITWCRKVQEGPRVKVVEKWRVKTANGTRLEQNSSQGAKDVVKITTVGVIMDGKNNLPLAC